MARRSGELAVMAGLLLLAGAVRCLNYAGVFTGSEVVFYGIDPFGHMRRIALAVAHFPQVPTFDHFLNFPTGAEIPWPVGFDFLLAGLAWLGGGFSPPATHTLEAFCALAVPALGALNVVLVYWLGRRMFGQAEGIVAAVLLALSGAHVNISEIGRVDHHVIEPFFAPLIFLGFVGALRAASARERRACIAGGALAAGLSFVFWTGSAVFAALPGLYVLACFALGPGRTGGAAAARDAARLYALAALVLLLFGWTSPAFRRLELTALILSWFHLLLLAGGAAVCAVLAVAARPAGERGGGLLAGACAAGAVLALAVPLAGGAGFSDLVKGFAYLLGVDPLSRSTLEARPISMVGPDNLAWAFTGLWVLAPLAFAFLLWRAARGRFADRADGFLLVWLLASILLCLAQFFRYRPHLASPLDLTLAIGLVAAWRGAMALHRRSGERPRRMAAACLVLAAVVVPVWLLKDTVNALEPTRFVNQAREFGVARDTFEWIRHGTPDPGGIGDPEARPAYGVLAPWRYGFWLNYIAERPNIASPNILLPVEVAGARSSLEVLLDEDEEGAARRAEALGARYVVASLIYPYLKDFLLFVGREPAELFTLTGEGDDAAYRFTDRYFRTLNSRMLLLDGSGADAFGVSGLGRFRMIYESDYYFEWESVPQDPPVALPRSRVQSMKVYERVEGALIEGVTTPLTTVRANVRVKTNTGREFVYERAGRSDGTGRFSVRVAYATGGRWDRERTAAVGDYEVSGAGGSARAAVTEGAVRQGGRVEVGALARGGAGAGAGKPL